MNRSHITIPIKLLEEALGLPETAVIGGVSMNDQEHMNIMIVTENDPPERLDNDLNKIGEAYKNPHKYKRGPLKGSIRGGQVPRIELLNVPLFTADDPYHYEYDNIPLKALMNRQELINLALDDVVDQMRDAIGTQGSVANRLNQSIEQDGGLKSTAIDEALHSIESHADSATYVRMTKAESDKLALISDEASDVVIQVDDGTSTYDFDSGTVIFESSSSVDVEVESPNIVKFNLGFDTSAAHRHYYELTPVHSNLTSPDYKNYKVNSTASAFISGSLRVYVNGVRIFSDESIYVPGPLVDDPWTLLKFTPDPTNGTFALSAAISDDDIIRIDFDKSLV